MANEPARKTCSEAGDAIITHSPTSHRSVGSSMGDRRQRNYTTSDFTKGNVPRHVWYLAWPQITDGFLAVVVQMSELVWVGSLGFQAVAGLGVGQVFLMVVMASRSGIDAVTRALVARSIGARMLSDANHIFLQSLTITSIFSVALVAAGLLFTELVLGFMGLSPQVVDFAASYMKVQYFTLSLASFQMLSAGALQASGNSLVPLRADVVSRVLHIVLAPMIIFGWFGMPELGIVGAAVAALLGRSVAVILNFYALHKGSSSMRLDVRKYKVDWQLGLYILRLAVPASITGMQRGLSQIAFIVIVTPFGDASLAAFSTIRRVETIANQLSMGLGRSAGAVGAQNLGASQPNRAVNAFRWAVLFGVIPSVVLASAFFAYSEDITKFVASDPEFIDLASRWLRVLAVGYFSITTVQVFTHGFNTSGQTFGPMLITLGTMWLFEIPVALALSSMTSLGQFGVPWAIVIGSTLRLVVFAWYFGRGGWLRVGSR